MTYLREYLSFLVRATLAAVAAHPVAGTPSPGPLAARLPRLRRASAPAAGVPVLLDLHEAMPEFFRSRFGGHMAGSSTVFSCSRSAYRSPPRPRSSRSTRRSATGWWRLGWPRIASRRDQQPVPQRFDPADHPAREFMADGRCGSPTPGPHPTYELDVLLDAVARLRAARPDLPVRVDLYAAGTPSALRRRSRGWGSQLWWSSTAGSDRSGAAALAADVGVAPTRRDRFTDFSLSTKIFEYAAMGKPVVCSSLRWWSGPSAGSAFVYPPGDRRPRGGSLAIVADPAARRPPFGGCSRSPTGRLGVQAPGYVDLVERLALPGRGR